MHFRVLQYERNVCAASSLTDTHDCACIGAEVDEILSMISCTNNFPPKAYVGVGRSGI